MDPFVIMENLDRVKPAFQPIISAVSHSIIGYEVLGRFRENEEWTSLGHFFHDPDVPDEYKAEVDDHLLHLAVAEMLETNNSGLLFVNRTAQQLSINNGEDFLQSLIRFEREGFSMDRIVLEITEHDFEEDFDVLNHLLIYYKTYGIQVAVDNVGAKSSNIDRIRQLRPHILKIDTTLVRNLNPDVFEDILLTLSVLARRIGAKFAYENIESHHQLQSAWKHGGYYYQGYYLAKPDFDLLTTDSLPIQIDEEINLFVQREKKLVEQRLAFAEGCEDKIKELLPLWPGSDKADSFLKEVSRAFNEESFRIYMCNSDGEQISSNIRKFEETWNLESGIKGSHWAFRPYFIENTMQMKKWKKGTLSDLYSDISTSEMIRTFSYPLSEDCFLFIDISFSFIYNHDHLLLQ
ncbi:MAG TPA: EAL-associated domain-containing protein [Planococcus sp. (in: firmicutes)]|nr:EAL-associated domain-containing protein [Planococcus sp. (in: firmicutes)]